MKVYWCGKYGRAIGAEIWRAIAAALPQGTIIPASDVTVADPFSGSLETLQADYPEINVTTENPKAIKDADIVILAVKPWLIDQVLSVVHLTPGKYWFLLQVV